MQTIITNLPTLQIITLVLLIMERVCVCVCVCQGASKALRHIFRL